jgi:hypothetical protein
MIPTKEQVVHDLTMACINGEIIGQALQNYAENNDDSSLIGLAADSFVEDAMLSYETIFNRISSALNITDTEE